MNLPQFKIRPVFCLIAAALSTPVVADSFQQKTSKLENLIEQAQSKGLDASREEMALHTAKLFMKWADLDEKQIKHHTNLYSKHKHYKKQAAQMAKELPDYERQSSETILDNAIEELTQVNAGEIVRYPVPAVDFKDVHIQKGQFRIEGKPVFIADYTWKPQQKELTRYFGGLKSAFIAPSLLQNEKGQFNRWHQQKLKALKKSDNIGQVFVSHNAIPDWVESAYPGITDKAALRYYAKYDIDHPKAKTLYGSLFAATVPLLKGTRATDLGYMIYNEPSFVTEHKKWNTGGISEYGFKKFRSWLKEKHGSIAVLNKLWKSNYKSFDEVTVELPMRLKQRGKPMWYDFMRFNQDRVTAWHQFLKDEVRKYDPTAMSHIKLMPWLWNQTSRSHGMDFEALIEQGDIIGFDAQAQYNSLRGEQMYFMPKYSFDWQSAMMTFDFFTSIQPEQVLWDSENHFFTSVSFQEKEVDPAYVKAIYWMAATHGLSGTSTWVWGRDAKGETLNRGKAGAEFITDVTHQPKGLLALTRTFMELNAHADGVVQLQKLPKPVRIFYSETDAIARKVGMESIRSTYDSLYFEGYPLGFVTQNILTKQDASHWELVVVQDIERVKESELKALQSYLDQGGRVLLDSKSLRKNEYGRKHSLRLKPSAGQLITFAGEKDLQAKVSQLSEQNGFAPELQLKEQGNPAFKTVAWRVAKQSDGSYLVSVINTGKKPASFELASAGKKVKVTNLFTGQAESPQMTLPVRGMRYLKVSF